MIRAFCLIAALYCCCASASEPVWVIGSFSNPAGAQSEQARLSQVLGREVLVLPHPDKPLFRVLVRQSEIDRSELDAAGISAWSAEMTGLPESVAEGAVDEDEPEPVTVVPLGRAEVEPETSVAETDRKQPEVTGPQLRTGETLVQFCVRVSESDFCQSESVTRVLERMKRAEQARARLMAECESFRDPERLRICRYAETGSLSGPDS